jgi:hypothetical protein
MLGREGKSEAIYLVALLKRDNRVIASFDLDVDLLRGTNEVVIGVGSIRDGTCKVRRREGWRQERAYEHH